MEAAPRPSAENSEEVRRQLKKTNLDEEGRAMPNPPADAQPDLDAAQTANGEHAPSGLDARGRLRRKRSHEEIDGEAAADSEATSNGKLARKRSKSGVREGAVADKVSSSQDTVEDPAVPGLAASKAELGNDDAANGALHPRSQTPAQGDGDETKDAALLSPKNKRTRDQYLQTSVATEADDGADAGGNSASAEGSSKPAKRARDSNSPQPDDDGEVTNGAEEGAEPQKIPPTSGFANTSAASPFATVAASKPSQTSASAFASSGFSTFASSSASPFAAAAGSAAGHASPFGGFGSKPSPAPAAPTEDANKSSPSPFGGPLSARAGNASPFATTGTPTLGGATPSGFGGLSGSTSSGFGGLGGGSAFGGGFAAVKPGAGLASFATPGAVGITGLSGKPSKPFGAATDDEDEESDKDGEDDAEPDAEELEAGIKSPPVTLAAEKKDKRFKEQSIATGEEDETTVFVARGKLFINEDKQWKERGTGALKLNKSTAAADGDDDEGLVKTRARLLLRAEGTQRVVLNSPIQKDLTYGNVKGGKPSSTEHFQFPSFYEGKLQILLVKMKQQNKEELWEHIEALKTEI